MPIPAVLPSNFGFTSGIQVYFWTRRAQFKADGEREKFRSKAEKLGLDAARIWLDWE